MTTEKQPYSSGNPIYNLPTTNQLKTLVDNTTLTQAQADEQKESAHYFIHAKVEKLITDFLAHKKKHGTKKEKILYKNMTVEQFLERLATKRPLAFHGGGDTTLLRNGMELIDTSGLNGNFNGVTDLFLKIGTENEESFLTLDDNLSYDEMQISTFLSAYAKTTFINNGARNNEAIPGGFALQIVDGFDPSKDKLPEGSYHTYILVKDDSKKNPEGALYFVDKSDPDPAKHKAVKLELAEGQTIAELRKVLPTKNAVALNKAQLTNLKKATTNHVQPSTKGTFQENADYAGMVGARFEKPETGNRPGLNEYPHMVITEDQNTTKNGYGKKGNAKKASAMKPFANLYKQTHFPTYQEAKADIEKNGSNSPYIKIENPDETSTGPDVYFNIAAYREHMRIKIEGLLEEANAKGETYLHVVGLGSGAWGTINGINCSQMLEEVQMEIYAELLSKNKYQNISDVDFSWFNDKGKQQFEKIQKNNKTNTNFHWSKRNPADPLATEHKNKNLVVIYAWDGNSGPGNEYNRKKLSDSGDPAAACCSTIAETQDPHKNNSLMDKLKNGTAVKKYGEAPQIIVQKSKSLFEKIGDAIASALAPKAKDPVKAEMKAIQKYLGVTENKDGNLVNKGALRSEDMNKYLDKVRALNIALGYKIDGVNQPGVIKVKLGDENMGMQNFTFTIPKADVDKMKNSDFPKKLQDAIHQVNIEKALAVVKKFEEACDKIMQSTTLTTPSEKVEALLKVSHDVQAFTQKKSVPEEAKQACGNLTRKMMELSKKLPLSTSLPKNSPQVMPTLPPAPTASPKAIHTGPTAPGKHSP